MPTPTSNTRDFLHLPILSRPDLGIFRYPGPGLGNLLFPIARAIAGQQKHGGSLIIPTMRQIKIGTFLRIESDKRTYGGILRQRNWREMALWLRAQYGPSIQEGTELTGAKVIRYSGMLNQFHDINCSGPLIRKKLISLSRKTPREDRFDVAMHVRLGDFEKASNEATEQNTRIPMGWYRNALAQALELRGRRKIRGILFSDEDPQRVIDELGLEGFVPEPRSNALNSMLLMAQADILIGSRSTFSLWGQFLGDSHAVWPRGFNLAKYKPVSPNKDLFV